MSPSDRERMALHEAGHVVVARAMRFEDVRVALDVYSDANGSLSGTDYLTPDDMVAAIPRLGTTKVAGMVAELLAGRDHREAGRIDANEALMLAFAGGEDPQATIASWSRDAYRILRAREHELAALEFVLGHVRTSLDSAAIDEVLELANAEPRVAAAGIIGNPAVQINDLVRVEDPKTGIAQNWVLDAIHTEMAATYLGTVSLVRGGVANDEITEPDPPPSDGEAEELTAAAYVQRGSSGDGGFVLDAPITAGHLLTFWSAGRVSSIPPPGYPGDPPGTGWTHLVTVRVVNEFGELKSFGDLYTRIADGTEGDAIVAGSTGCELIEWADGVVFGGYASHTEVPAGTTDFDCGGAVSPGVDGSYVVGCMVVGQFGSPGDYTITPDAGVTVITGGVINSSGNVPAAWIGDIPSVSGPTTVGGTITAPAPAHDNWAGVTFWVEPT